MNDKKKEEEELLDFDFDELPNEDGKREDSLFETMLPEEEVIELTDVVERGDKARAGEESGLDDFDMLMDEEKPARVTERIERIDQARAAEDSGPDDFDMLMEEEKPAEKGAAGESIGISEERIEAIVTRVVGDVVERVTRETMTKVADKVIREAIDNLRQSLDIPPE